MRLRWMICVSVICMFGGSMGAPAQASDPKRLAVGGAWKRASDLDEAYAFGLAKSRAEARRYKGLLIVARQGDLGIPKGVASVLQDLDFVPQERIDRFRWVVEEMDAPITGWNGYVETATPVIGGFVVDLKIYPRHDTNNFFAPGEYTIERYEIIGKNVRHLGSEAPPKRGIIVF